MTTVRIMIADILHQLDHQSIDDQSVMRLMQLSRKGIDYSTFAAIARQSAFDISQWSDLLHVSERSFMRYKKSNSTFDQLASERIIKLFMLNKQGIELFGNKENFRSWLGASNIALGGIKPVQLLDNAFGIEFVSDELNRIDHGILA